MIVKTLYERKTFRVQAVRVSSDNMWEVAGWCEGRYLIGQTGSQRPCIEIKLGHDAQRKPKYDRAYIGDWVTLLPGQNSFRIYKEKTFLEAFQQVMDHVEKRTRILEAVVGSMGGNLWGIGQQGDPFTAESIVDRVMEALGEDG